jgi:acyl carrier protein
MDVQQTIRDFVLQELVTGDEGLTLKDDDSLFQLGIIDSLSIIQLLAFMDSEFDVQIQSGDVNAANFDSIHRLSAYISDKLASKPQTPFIA